MGRMLLFLIVGMGALFSVANLNMVQSNARMIHKSSQYYERMQSKNLSESGIQMALMRLAQDSSYKGVNNLSLGKGRLTIAVTNTKSLYPDDAANMNMPGLKQVVSTGNFNGVTKVIKAVIQLPLAPPPTAPQFFTYALASESNLNMNGNISIRDDNNTSWNASVHTNSNLSINGNNLVRGFGHYAGTAISNPAKRINTTFQPNVNPNKLPVHSKVPRIEIPDFNPDDYLSLPNIVQTSGNLIKSGNTVLGTKEDPKIWYVSGDLTLSGNVSGYGCFIVKGQINLNGNVTITATDPTKNNLGLYAKGDININGNVGIYASQMLSARNINMNGNCELHGTAAARGAFNFNGNVKIYYRPPNADLTKQFWTPPEATLATRPTVASYYE